MTIHEKINVRSYCYERYKFLYPLYKEKRLTNDLQEIRDDLNSGYRSEMTEATRQDIYFEKKVFQRQKLMPNPKKLKKMEVWQKGITSLKDI